MIKLKWSKRFFCAYKNTNAIQFNLIKPFKNVQLNMKWIFSKWILSAFHYIEIDIMASSHHSNALEICLFNFISCHLLHINWKRNSHEKYDCKKKMDKSELNMNKKPLLTQKLKIQLAEMCVRKRITQCCCWWKIVDWFICLNFICIVFCILEFYFVFDTMVKMVRG